MNKDLSIKEIIKCTNGKLIIGNEEYICENYSKDTRTIQKNDVYIAIKGENFDGNMFWKEALEKGAKVAIVQNIDFSKEDLSLYGDKVIIEVEDTKKALCDIAKYKRSLYGSEFPLVAVTGSVGKTSTKDIIASVLSKKYKVLKTEGNNNNDIGLPLTILKLKDHEAAVIEMGMNHLGEISELSKIAKPKLGVITNVGTAHIGNLGSRENILKAKLEILDGMENDKIVINNDNDMLHNWYLANVGQKEIVPFGIDSSSLIAAENINMDEKGSKFICNTGKEKFEVYVPVGGKHFVYNALCAICVGKEFGLSIEEIQHGIEEFELTKKRMEIRKINKNITIINDSYNASYESMKYALEYLKNISGNRKIAVLGDMFELGDYAEELHRKVGLNVANNSIDILICTGENAKYISEEAIKNGMNIENVFYENNLEDVEVRLKEVAQENDCIFFKASNGMRFYTLVDKIIKSEEI